MGRTPSNSFHYAGAAKEVVENTALAPTKLWKFQDFKGGAVIESEESKGHTGSRGLTDEIIRTKAYAEPEIKDLLRPDASLEQIMFAFFGAGTPTIQGSGPSYKTEFTAADELSTFSITHGFNYSDDLAKVFTGAVCDNLEFGFSTEESPNITHKWMSNFPKFGVAEPTLTFPTTPAFKASQLQVLIGEVGSVPTTPLGCFKEGKATLSNNGEIGICAGDTFGIVSKDLGELGVEGSMTTRYVSDMQREWATGSSSGTDVSEDGFARAIRFILTGGNIETTNNYQFILDILNAEITALDPTESGDDAKTFDWSFKGMVDDTNQKVKATVVSKLTAIT